MKRLSGATPFNSPKSDMTFTSASPPTSAQKKRVRPTDGRSGTGSATRKSITSLLGLLNRQLKSDDSVSETPRTSLQNTHTKSPRSNSRDASANRTAYSNASMDDDEDCNSGNNVQQHRWSSHQRSISALPGDGLLIFSPSLIEDMALLETKMTKINL